MRVPPRLVALSPGRLSDGDLSTFVRDVECACAAGLRGLLLREPGLGDRAYLDLARRLRARLAELDGGWFGVHDRLHVALAVAADGAHLGFRSLPVDSARELLPRGVALGLSVHAPDDDARWLGPDYLVFGPVHATPSKRGLVEPTGIEGLARAVERAGRTPLFAIGGLEPDDAAGVLACGAAGLCVLRGVFGAPDPADATRCYLDAIARAGSEVGR